MKKLDAFGAAWLARLDHYPIDAAAEDAAITGRPYSAATATVHVELLTLD